MPQRGKGEGSIRKRKDGRWEGSITIGITAKGNPKRRYVYGRTRAEVAKAHADLLAKHGNGTLLEPSKMTVKECVERWLRNKTGISERTREGYTYEAKPILDRVGNIKLQALETYHVRDAYTDMAVCDLSNRARQKSAMHLRSALNEAVHEGLVLRNVAIGVKVPTKRVDKAAEAWEAHEVRAFLDAAQDDPLYTLFYTFLTLGLRRGEALGLPWSLVNLDRG